MRTDSNDPIYEELRQERNEQKAESLIELAEERYHEKIHLKNLIIRHKPYLFEKDGKYFMVSQDKSETEIARYEYEQIRRLNAKF
jgi:hypothetical protein